MNGALWRAPMYWFIGIVLQKKTGMKNGGNFDLQEVKILTFYFFHLMLFIYWIAYLTSTEEFHLNVCRCVYLFAFGYLFVYVSVLIIVFCLSWNEKVKKERIRPLYDSLPRIEMMNCTDTPLNCNCNPYIWIFTLISFFQFGLEWI